MQRRSQRSIELHVGGRCQLACDVCDCRTGEGPVDETTRQLEGGGARVVLRGAPHDSPRTQELVSRARAEGFAEIVVRTNALAYQHAADAAALASLGATSVLVPLFSHVPQAHDRIAGRPGALVGALVGMRTLAAAGLGVEIEIPLLAPALQKPASVVDLAHRAVPALRAARFFIPRGTLPPPLAPPRWSEGAPLLAAAIARCRELGVKAALRNVDAIPLCALADHPDLGDAFRFNPLAKGSLAPGSSLAAACAGCAVRRQCAGVAEAYRARHGEADLRPYTRRPPLMYEQRTSRRAPWTDERRRAAAKANLLVVRPTVNCNQDCTFCSANETSKNVWSDPGEMLRAIARAARRGVTRLSFSGGEPTLSRHLASYVRAASRCGVREIELVTNGVLLDTEPRVRALREAGLTHAFVSLHAHDEEISRRLTQKVGDFERTVHAIGHLLDAGVVTAINHVVTSRNHRYLRHFVELAHARFGGRAAISFAFVTPQYKALENLELLPRLSDVVPHLRAAMHRAVELGQPFVVGSRQGIPPCFLGEFRGWSDAIELANEARSEDRHQKQRAPACDRCRYTNLCPGLRRAYVERYGLDELRPVEGAPFTDDEITAIRGNLDSGWAPPRSFDDVAEPVRDRAAEASFRDESTRTTLALPVLPAFTLARSRPLRLALLGTGRQARRIALAARSVREVSIEAVASPHALHADSAEFGGCNVYADAAAALDELRPEAVIIASATHTHDALARLAIARGIPALVERPLTGSEDAALALVRHAAEEGAVLLPAHRALFAPGLARFFDACDEAGDARRVTWLRRCTPESPDAPRRWSRSALFQALYDALVVTGRAAGGGCASVRAARHHGDSAPHSIRVELAYPRGEAEVAFDFAATTDEVSIATRDATWRRASGKVTLGRGGGVETVPAGGELEAMLRHLHEVVLGEASPVLRGSDAVDVLRTARAVLDALEAAGAPFENPNAPKHVASRAL